MWRLDDLGEVGRHDGGGVDHRVAAELRLVAQAVVDPGRRQPEGRLQHVVAGQLHLPAHRVHGHVQVREDRAGAGLDLLDADDVLVGVELHVVEDAHRRHDEAGLAGELAAQSLDLLGEAVGAVRRVDERQQGVADLDLEIVDLEDIRDRLFRRRTRGADFLRRRAAACDAGRGARLVLPVDLARQPGGAGRERQEGQHGDARQKGDAAHHGRRHAERLRVVGELPAHGLVGGAAHARLGDEQARRRRHDERRHLADEAVAAGEQV